MASSRHSGRPLARGDVVLVRFPFTDLSASKLRPAVVVAVAPGSTDLTLAFLGSLPSGTLPVSEVPVLPAHPEFSLTGLAAPSRIRAGKLVTLSRTLLRRWLGRLGPLLAADLDRALIAALDINLVPYREEGRREERRRLSALHRAGGTTALLADLGAPTS